MRGGLPASIFSILLVWYFFIPPKLSWHIDNPHTIWSMLLFLIMGWLFSDSQERLTRAYKRIAEALEESQAASQATFNTILQTNHNAMLIVAQDGRIAQVNLQAERMFAYPAAVMLEMTVEDLIPERLRGRHRQQRAVYAANPQPRRMAPAGTDLFARRSNGSEIPVEISLGPISMQGVPYVITTIADISARRMAEMDIRTLNATLEQKVETRTTDLLAANQELEAFSYSVSHGLRAPLRAIDGFSQIVLKQYASALDPEARGHLQSVRDTAVQMGHLVDDLLAFSRLGRKPLSKQQVPTGIIVEQVLRDMRQQAAGRSVSVSVGNLPGVWGDAALLKQVFMNLIDNAFKYTRQRDEAVVEIGSRNIDGEQVFFVRDNGVGFDMQYANNLFGVFQRLHRAEDFEGTGVGLAIVQRIVHHHGGRVWAEAAIDRGATFYFTTENHPHA
jgi:PAS domain S-box-containing protein